MKYWLMKSEPEAFSIDHLRKNPQKTHCWDGVRNYQARNMMHRDMMPGDLAFFYHSNAKPSGIAGIMEIVKKAYPDHTQFDPESQYYDPKATKEKPRWFMVDVKFKKQFDDIITLEMLRQHPILKDMIVLKRGNRLSITPVTKEEWEYILCLYE